MVRARACFAAGSTLLLLSVAATAAAESAPARLASPQVEYEAELTIESGLVATSGPVHYTPLKERRTLALRGMRVPAQVMIVRRDKDLIWILNPASKSFYEVPITASVSSVGAIPSGEIEKSKRVGREKVAGVDATRYQVSFTEREGVKLSGTMWLSDDDILLRIDGETIEGEAGQSRPFRLTLSDLKRQTQPPELFEIPEGFVQVIPSHPTRGILAPPPRR